MGWFAGHTWTNAVNDIPNCLNYCVIFTVLTSCTYMATGHIIQAGGPWVGDTLSALCQ